MKKRVMLGTAGAAGVVIVLGQVGAFPGATGKAAMETGQRSADLQATGVIGPDVIVGALPNTHMWSNDGTRTSYSVATTSCNIGDMDLDWIDTPSNRHPVIGQNMYKLTGDGRLEQIGLSWLKHGFCALQLPLGGCGTCNGGGGCLDHLTPGCSDPYSATRNGTQSGLGPRWQVNPVTGVFPIPWDQGEGTSGAFRRRIIVSNTDLNEGANPDAKYFVEGQYVTQDDSAWGNQNNNASYRQVSVNQVNFALTEVGPTAQMSPAIQAWQDFVEGVELTTVLVPGDGKYIVGSRAWERVPGSWYYEYAVYNMNADRAAGSFAVTMPDGVNANGIGFRDVDYHSGEAWDTADWTWTTDDDTVRWATAPFETNNDANALRWGTMYNFRFIANAPPGPGTVELGIFKPGSPTSMMVNAITPQTVIVECPLDLDSSGAIDFADLLQMLSVWGPCGGCPEDFDEDGVVGFLDLLQVLSNWGPCD